MSKKISIFTFIVMLLSQTMFTALGLPLKAAAQSVGNEFITSVQLLDNNGNILDKDKNQNNKFDRTLPFTIQYFWSLTNISTKEGESYSFNLPAEIIMNNDEKGILITDQKIEIGTFQVSKDGKVTVTFNKEAATNQQATGLLNIKAHLNQKLFNGKELASIQFSTKNGLQLINIPLLPTASQQSPGSSGVSRQNPTNNTVTSLKTQANTPTEITKNILTNVVLRDKNGNILDTNTNPDLQIKLGSDVTIEYDWELENNHGYKAGSTYKFKLLDVFTVFSDLLDEKLMLDGVEVGTFSVKMDGTVTMTFNEEIEKRSNVHGKMKLWTAFQEKIEGSVEQELVFPIRDDKVIKVPIRFEPKKGSSIDKKGVPNKSYNASEIEWTVDFNKQLSKMEEAILRDPIQKGQALQPTSIQLYELDVQLNGSVKQGKLVDPNEYEITKTNGQDFQLNFKTPINSAYRIVYKTDVTDHDQKTFVNEATLSGKGVTDLQAKATVSINRGNPLAKESAHYNAKEQTIDWVIKFNYNEKTFSQQDAYLVDMFTNSQHLVNQSLKVIKVTIDENEKEKSEEVVPSNQYTVVPVSDSANDGFKLQFLHDINSAYKIMYQTKANDRVFDKETIKNTVTTKDNSSNISTNIQQGILKKSNFGTDYKKKTTKWEINFNEDSFEMKDVKLTDVFPNKGLTLLPNTLKISRDDANGSVTLVRDVDYVLDEANFIITFNQPITKPHRITYETKFDYEARDDRKKDYLENKVTLDWIDSKGDSKQKDATATLKPDDHTKNNGFKNGSYNATTKEITWNIGLNYNLLTIKKPVVEDYILSGQKLVADSIKVYEMDISGKPNGGAQNSSELTIGKDFNLIKVTDSSGNEGFRIEFVHDIDSPYVITYKTNLEGQHIKKTYENRATLYSEQDTVTTLDASVSVKHGEEFISKSGLQQSGKRLVDWRVNINFGQSEVSNAKVIDKPSANQILLEDTFHLYATSVHADGSVLKGAKLVKDTDYTLTIETDDMGQQKFELVFLKKINSAYILEYQSYVNAMNGEAVTNDASFIGDQIKTGTTTSNEKVIVRVTSGSGSGSGKTGALEVTKKDDVTGDPLEGAVFTLFDREGKIAIRTLKTDKDGKAIFKNLLFDDYVLQEKEAPAGYVVGISDKEQVKINNEKVTITVTNKKIIPAVELEKLDATTNDPLQGAEFELYQKVGNDYVKISTNNLITNANGIIFEDNLQPGEYQFVEVVAPHGYKMDQTPVDFIIKEKQTEKTKVTKKNEIKLGSVELVKVDSEDHTITLAGAEFELQDVNGKTIKTGLTTNTDGKVVVSDLRPGDYQFIETKAPVNYDVHANPIKFTISKNQQVTESVIAENKLTPGEVELTKVDVDDPTITLPEAEFELRDKNGIVVQTGLKTDTNGKLKVSKLQPGTYQFVETKAPLDYQLDVTPIVFTIEKGQKSIKSVVAKNGLILGTVQLIKVDKDNNTEKLENAEFELQDNSGKVLQANLKTNRDGSLVVSDLKPGKYQFVETKAPFGYELDPTPISFEIIRGQKETLVLPVHPNTLIPGTVELTKVSAHSGATLAGAEFELQDSTGKAVEGTARFTTDTNGKITVPGLRPGTYQFVEITAPNGYYVDSTPIVFTIDKGQTVTKAVTAKNTLITGSVELTKVDKDDKKIMLPGVEFELQDTAGNVLQSGLTTNETGVITISGLVPGEYQFVETKAPFGYKLDVTPIKFTIVGSQGTAVAVENELIPSAVELTKVDYDNNELTLAGAEFELQDRTGKTLETGFTTDEQGKIIIPNLKPGEYQLVETKAPFGYDLDKTPIGFAIEKGQTEATTVTVTNKLSTGTVELTKVDNDNHDILLEGAEFALQDREGNILKAGLTTNSTGKIIVDGLKPGDYQFVETKAPKGYELDAIPLHFTIEKGQVENGTVVAKNKKIIIIEEETNQPGGNTSNDDRGNDRTSTDKTPDGGLPNTSTSMFNMMIAGIVVFFVGVAFFFRRRRA